VSNKDWFYSGGACLFLLAISAGSAVSQDAKEIVARADRHARGRTSKVEMLMRVERPDWSREMRMKVWSKANDLSLVLLTAPARDKGSSFLKRKTEVWNWLPSVEKAIKIPPSMMMQSWMGSDFTNDDLVKESSVVLDYIHRLVGDTVIDTLDCHVIEMIPRPEAAVVWGKLLACISKDHFLQMRFEYYDEDLELINVMSMSNIRELGGRLLPTRMEMTPVDKPGQRTVMEYIAAEYNLEIEDSFFSQQNMKRVR
jgi:outer membrane lipoprotein-sorting protein